MKNSRAYAMILALVLVAMQVVPAFAAAPVLTLPGTNPVSVNENQWVILDTTATVTDADGNWELGTLSVDVTDNPDATDELQVRDDACNAVTDVIDIGGGEVRRCTGIGTFVVIGTITGQTSKPLSIIFNANATSAYIQDVIRQIRFRPNTNTPSTLQRTVTFNLTDGAGESSGNVTKLVNVNAVNDAPQISQWGNNPDPTYTENNAPLQLDTNATIIDPDSVDLNGTTITLSLFNDATNPCGATEDVLAIGAYGNISTSGSDVLYGATTIATFSGGDSCSPLAVTLNSNADNTSISALANAFTYQNTSDNPDTTQRRLRLRTVQGAQTDTDSAKYITVVAANDAPVVTLPGTDPITADEQTWTVLDNSATVMDPDNGTLDFNSGTLTVQITNGFTGDRLNIRNEGTGANQISRSGGDLSASGTISYGGNPIGTYTWAAYTLSVSFNTADATIAAAEALLRNIQYIVNVNNPNTTQRNIDFTISDGDGGTSKVVTKRVDINPVNDNPVVSNFTPDLTYTENDPATQIDADVSITDPDYQDYDGGVLTADFSAGGTTDDQLAIGNIGEISTNASNQVIYTRTSDSWSCTLGTYSGGVNGSALTVNLSGGCAINTRISLLLQALTYANSSENPAATRTVQIVVTDGDGGTSAAVTKDINVTAVNDEPSFTMGSNQTVLEDAGAQSIAWATNISDGDNATVTQKLTFTVSNNNNSLFSAQPAIAENGTLSYTPADDANGSATVTVESLKDDGGTANGGDDTFVPPSNTFTISVTAVNDAPSFTSGGNVSVAEDSGAYSASWATLISAGPADESGQKLTFNITNNTNTALFSIAPAIASDGTLSFTPAANTIGSATITLELQDDGGTANVGADTSASQNFTITVTNQNDPPTDITLSNNTVAEKEPVNTVVGSLTTTDIDPGDSHTYTLVTGVAGCDDSDNASFVIGGLSDDELQTNTIFDYETPPTSFNVCIQTEDSAGETFAKAFTINVTNINDAPVNTVPGAQITDDGMPLELSTAKSNVISVSDVDAGTADLEITLSVNNGLLTLNGTSGLLFSTGTGTNDASMTFTGALAEINAALDGMTYTPNPGYTGPETLTITSNDQGNTGPDGAKTDTDTLTITIGNVPPKILLNGVNSDPDTDDGVLSEGEEVKVNISKLYFTFSEDMDTTTIGDQVTDKNNYLVLKEGSQAGFQTSSCKDAKDNGVHPADEKVEISYVTYQQSTHTATLYLSTALLDGKYRIFACGTATLRDLAGNALAGDDTTPGTDFTRNFSIQVPSDPTDSGSDSDFTRTLRTRGLPATGFAPDQVTLLPAQPADKLYASTDMILNIPAINQRLTIVGVPQTNTGWDVTWLGNNAGWLNGTAFPTWAGNTVITAHVWNANNQPGPFVGIKSLRYGDRFTIEAFGQVYTYEVRENKLVFAQGASSVMKHEEFDWVTLVTCEAYSKATDTYPFRRLVRAVLVSVK